MTYFWSGVTKISPAVVIPHRKQTMSLPLTKPVTTTDSNPLISTYSILLLSGMLFGICISGAVNTNVKTWVLASGTLGLVAYLVMSHTAYKQKQMQLRLATMQVEERLDRHSHFDLRAEDLQLDQPSNATRSV